MVNVKGSEDIGGRYPGGCWHMRVSSSGRQLGTGDRWGCHLQRQEVRSWKIKGPERECIEGEGKWAFG